MSKKNIKVSSESKKYKLNQEDGWKLLKGAGFAVGGAICVWGISVLPQIEFGPELIWLAPIISVLLNTGVKFFSGQE